MIITAYVGTMDELDILPGNIEHLRSIGVDRIVVCDAGSTDGTLEWLAEVTTADDLSYLQIDRTAPTDTARRELLELARASGSDWVLFQDSDEFWLPASGSLRTLRDLDGADLLLVPRYNVVPRDEPLLTGRLSPDGYQRVLLFAQPLANMYQHAQEYPGTPWIHGALEPKIMARPEAIAELHPGLHDATFVDIRRVRAVAGHVLIAHVPVRSYERFVRRAENVREHVRLTPEVWVGSNGWQWQRWAHALDEGTIRDEYQRQFPDEETLARMRDLGDVRPASEVLESDIPDLPSERSFSHAMSRAEPWLSAAGKVCRRHGIIPAARPEIEPFRAWPTVRIAQPDGHVVVTFYGRWRDGNGAFERERAALELTAGGMRIAAPRPIASGSMGRDWRYLVATRIPGLPLSTLDESVGEEARADLSVWMGRQVHRLHTLALDPESRESGLATTRDWLTERLPSLPDRMAASGLIPEHLLDEISDWLPAKNDLIGEGRDACLTHGQLDSEHIYLKWSEPDVGLVPAGIVDFSQATVGPALRDLGPIWTSFFAGDCHRLAAFLAAARFRGWKHRSFPRIALAWVMLNPGSAPNLWPDASTATSLDELAQRWFGSLSAAVASA